MGSNRIVDRFIRYVKCSSESLKEGNFCRLLEDELKSLGAKTERQMIAKEQLDSDGWNIYAYISGEGEPILLAAHLDTMSPGENIEPVIENGIIRSIGDTVLGADDKAGVAAIMEAVAYFHESGITHRPIEILFTLCEEIAMIGSKYADYSQIKSKHAIVLDHTVIGSLINHAPAYMNLFFTIHGRAAHAGVSPQLGINALRTAANAIENIPTGSIGDLTVQNIANFFAPGRRNVVPDIATFEAEIRSYTEAELQFRIEKMKESVRNACEEAGATFEVYEERVSNAIYVPEDSEFMQSLCHAIKELGIEPIIQRTFGGSDCTWISEHGISPVNIGVGMKDVHSTKETIAVNDLITSAEILVSFLSRA